MSRYTKSILAVLAAVLTALTAAVTDNRIDAAEAINVAIAGVTAVGVFVVPNLPGVTGRYAKTGVAVTGAALAGLASALSDGVLTQAEVYQVALAGLAAVGVFAAPNAEGRNWGRPVSRGDAGHIGAAVAVTALAVTLAAVLVGALNWVIARGGFHVGLG